MKLYQVIANSFVLLPTLTISAVFWGQPNHLAYTQDSPHPKAILGNPEYQAICYGGFRKATRDQVPSVDEIQQDMRILSAMGIKVLRTYNTQQFAHAENVLQAIERLRSEDDSFEMYVMLGAWINCKNAWTGTPDHSGEDEEQNAREIRAAVRLANQYPHIVKFIAVGNEAMVHWATGYFVSPSVILRWVEHLKTLQSSGDLRDVWITSSDNFASWGGGDGSYHNDELKKLIKTVDFVSLHTYPFHDSHYNSKYWLESGSPDQSPKQRAVSAVQAAVKYAQSQYQSTSEFVRRVDPAKPIHIGETGWATSDNRLYGETGSGAADEFKQAEYYRAIRNWTNENSITCFYFEAFDEIWKDAGNPGGSENHFGLFDINGHAKFALWNQVDGNKFDGLGRGKSGIEKSQNGSLEQVVRDILTLPSTEKSNEIKSHK